MLTGPKDALYMTPDMLADIRARRTKVAQLEDARVERAPERVRGGSEKKEDGEPTLIEKIRDQGMQAFIEEMKEKKKEEMRQKILMEMGLSEETLSKMSPEARAEIEKIIAAEIKKRMQAENELDRQQKGQVGPGLAERNTFDPGQDGVQAMAKIDGAGVGLGPLLALQEADLQDNEGQTVKDRDDG